MDNQQDNHSQQGASEPLSPVQNPAPPNNPSPASKWVTFFILDLGQVPCLMGVIHYSSTETTIVRFATYVITDLVTTLV